MSIKTFELGNHSLEIDTTYGEVVIFSSGKKTTLSLNEASSLFSALLGNILPAQFIQDENRDPLQINVLRSEVDKYERVTCHAVYLIEKHLRECDVCRYAEVKNVNTLSHVVVTCISDAEGIRPYLDTIVNYNQLRDLTYPHLTPEYMSRRTSFEIGQVIQLKGTTQLRSIVFIDDNFEGEGLGYGVEMTPEDIAEGLSPIEMFSASQIEKPTSIEASTFQCSGCRDKWCEGCSPI